jgi:predicted RND superfamily exporter protein
VEKFIEKEYKATIEFGIATRIKQFNRARNGGEAKFFTIPKDKNEYKKTRNKVLKFRKSIQLSSLVSADKKATFIGAKTKDYGSYETRIINKKLLKFAEENTPNISINLAGTAYTIDETNVNVTHSMIWSLLTIIFFIMILISIIFRSLFVGIVSLLPNILPLLAITSVVGWFDLGMNIATTIVYTIAFGIAVDDTIHFLSRYKIEKEKPISNQEAITNTMKTSGGAILLTTLILVFGFGVLIFSDFYANFITGLLVCIGLVVALICDLYLLPALLLFVKKK